MIRQYLRIFLGINFFNNSTNYILLFWSVILYKSYFDHRWCSWSFWIFLESIRKFWKVELVNLLIYLIMICLLIILFSPRILKKLQTQFAKIYRQALKISNLLGGSQGGMVTPPTLPPPGHCIPAFRHNGGFRKDFSVCMLGWIILWWNESFLMK